LRVTNGIVTDAEDLTNWQNLLIETKLSREGCVEAMRRTTGQYIRTGLLTLVQTQGFFKDVSVFVDWFERANCPDLKLWITSEVGSAYENKGFASKSYYNESLKNELMNIYNGAY
jgi:hypothetical protein